MCISHIFLAELPAPDQKRNKNIPSHLSFGLRATGQWSMLIAIMANDINLISNRYREVEQEIARLKGRLAEMETERGELEMAGRVVARLSGAKWPPARTGDEPKQEATSGAKPEMTLTDMILAVMTDEYRRTLGGSAPKNVTKAIARDYWSEVDGGRVSSTMWRMAQPKDGRLVKDDHSSLYMLADKLQMPHQKENPEGDKSEQEAPSGLFSNQQTREAGPGGGT